MKIQNICIAFLTVGCALAQDQQPPVTGTQNPKQADQKTQDQKTQDEKDKQGAQDQTQQDQQSGQTYEGPSILSRDKSLIGQRGGRLIDLRFFGEVTGVYDSGLTPISTNSQGNLINVGGTYGVETGFGAIGSRRWRRDQISVDYHGSYRNYTAGGFGGWDQFLNLAYAHRLKRRMTLDLKETLGRSSLANGAFSYLPLTNADLFAVPTNELFDVPTNYLQSRVDLTWQITPRFSVSAGGEGFLVRRSSLALAGLNGYASHGTMAYRLTRRQTVSFAYNYSYFDFQRLFGNAHVQSVTVGYSIGLSRRWEFALDVGGVRSQALGLNQVSIDPAIAAIVGRNFAVVQFDRTVYGPSGDLRLTRTFDRSALTMGYTIGTTPGNGVYLTSKQNQVYANYSYTGYRRFTLGSTASYTELSSVGQTLGKYTSMMGGLGMTYRIVRSTHLQARYDYRHYSTQNAGFQKDSQRVTVGLAFSPGETPLAIW